MTSQLRMYAAMAAVIIAAIGQLAGTVFWAGRVDHSIEAVTAAVQRLDDNARTHVTREELFALLEAQRAQQTRFANFDRSQREIRP